MTSLSCIKKRGKDIYTISNFSYFFAFGEADKIYFLGEDESNYWGRIKFTVEERSNFDFVAKGGVSFFFASRPMEEFHVSC